MKKEDIQFLKLLSDKVRGNIKYVLELIDIFLAQVPESIRLMEKSVEKQNWQELYFEAHKIKSTIKVLNLEKALPLIKELERVSRKEIDVEEIPVLFNKFNDAITFEVERLKNIKEFIKSEKTPKS